MTFENQPIDDKRLYKVGLQRFHMQNMEDNLAITPDEVSANRKPRIVATSCRDILDEYLSTHQHLDRQIDGRLTLI